MRLVCFLRRINRYNPDIRYDWYAVIDSRWFELAVTQGVQERLQRAFHSGFIEVLVRHKLGSHENNRIDDRFSFLRLLGRRGEVACRIDS